MTTIFCIDPDGTVFSRRGAITSLERSFVTLRLADGRVLSIPRERILRVEWSPGETPLECVP